MHFYGRCHSLNIIKYLLNFEEDKDALYTFDNIIHIATIILHVTNNHKPEVI